MSKNVLVFGATGYIGGAVLVRTKREFPSWHYTALVRNPSAFDAVRAAGANEILYASHSDLDKIKEAASKADIVLNCADADDLPLTKAIIDGLKARGGRPILIHTSGTGVVQDKAVGELTKEASKIWNDNSEDDIRNIDKNQPHRGIDLTVFAADEAKAVNAYIVCPSTIYGIGDGPVHRVSQQIPTVVRTSITLNKALYVGAGTNIWNNVHIADLADLYDLVLRRALSGADDDASPYTKFYFGSAHEHVWGEVQRAIGRILIDLGRLPNVPPQRVEYAAVKDIVPLLKYVATNSRSRADRGFALGWTPRAPSLQDSLKADVEAALKEL